MNSTLASIILFVCVIFSTYKLVKHISRKSSKINNKVTISESTFDVRFYSTPSFNFPNIQSESDIKFINLESDLPNAEIDVKQYCKY